MPCDLLRVGLAGFGTVGAGVFEILTKNARLITARMGGTVRLEVAKIAVKDLQKPRDKSCPTQLFVSSWHDLISDPTIDIIVELIGGTTHAYELVKAALLAKKPVVTGNKALLAEHGPELFLLSKKHNTPIHFEAAVAGGIPIIRAIQDSFIANRLHSIVGILNGTSNFILEKMSVVGCDFATALAQAQQLGYAEADPALDVNGWDAAHKALLLAWLAYGFAIRPEEIFVAGIEDIRPIDLSFAARLGYCIKLLCVIREHESGAVELRVQPSFVPKDHILASVNGVFNAVAVRGDAVGEALFYGRGAGKSPTASAVVADIVEAARSLEISDHRGFLPYRESGHVLPADEISTPYYVRFHVTDRPGVIAQIAAVLAEHGVGISGTSSPVDPAHPDADFVDLVFLLHTCLFGKLRKALAEVEKLDCIKRRPVVFRIENLLAEE